MTYNLIMVGYFGLTPEE